MQAKALLVFGGWMDACMHASSPVSGGRAQCWQEPQLGAPFTAMSCSILVALSSVVSLGGLWHTQAGFVSRDQPAFVFLNVNLLLPFVPTRCSLPLSPVFHICSLPVLTGCLKPIFCLTGPCLTNLFFSSPALRTHSGCLPRAPCDVAIACGELMLGKQCHIPALPSRPVSLLIPCSDVIFLQGPR